MFEILLKELVTFYEPGEIVKLKLNLMHKLSLVIVSKQSVNGSLYKFLILDVIILIGWTKFLLD